MKIYACNEDFFAEQTPLSCYWAGFIAADGCVYHNSKGADTLQVELSYKDFKHIEKFVEDINYTGRIG